MSNVTFDLITIIIKEESVQARPIEWEKVPIDSFGRDSSGDPAKPSKYMTTCPHCAQLIKFSPADLYDGVDLKCPECKSCTPASMPQVQTIEQEMAAPPEIILHLKAPASIEGTGPFVDPIAEGRISTDNYIL
jgi:hypothetical protein